MVPSRLPTCAVSNGAAKVLMAPVVPGTGIIGGPMRGV
jgi:ribosomal protein S5